MTKILISHRGNTLGPSERENSPSLVEETLRRGYEVEIDLHVTDNLCYLGHDFPQYQVGPCFLSTPGLWIHCKNIRALEFCKSLNLKNNYFWHQEDDVTLTSTGVFWTYPGKALTRFSIAVMPETAAFENLECAMGICSDFIESWSTREVCE